MRPRVSETLAALPITLFLLVPPLVLLIRGNSLALASLQENSTREAIFVSLKTTTISVAFLLLSGIPLCQLLAHSRGWVSKCLDAWVDLPVVLPPAAAGIALLLAFGRNGMIPTHLPFSVGAVICAQLFVSAPLFVRNGTAAILSVPKEVLEIAKTEGAGKSALFFSIVVPVGAPLFLAGIVLAWARALGEFGATLLFAGNLPGRTQTMPLAIYLGFETNFDQAIGLSVILLMIAGTTLLITKLLLTPNLKIRKALPGGTQIDV